MTETASRQIILIVDDAAANIAVLAEILKPHYQVRVAKDGARALKIAALTPHPDAILLDVEMPVMDGYEACRLLKADQQTRSIPVIFVTGHGDLQEEAKGMRLGAAGFLKKPVDPARVLSVLTDALG